MNNTQQFVDHKIYAFQTRFFQSGYLLLHYGVKSQIRSKQSNLQQNYIYVSIFITKNTVMYPNSVDIADRYSDFFAQLILIKFHFDNFKGKSFME